MPWGSPRIGRWHVGVVVVTVLLGSSVALPGLVALTAPAAGATGTELSLSPTDRSVAPGESVTYEVVVGSVDDGVGSYDLVVRVGNGTTARIADATNEIGGDDRIEVNDDGTTVQIAAFGGDTADEGSEVVIATVTVTGESPGTARLALDAESVNDENGGDQYALTSVEGASVTVRASDPPAGAELSLRPRERTLATGNSTTYDIVVGPVDGGVGSYDVTVDTSDPATARITGATNEIGGVGEVDRATDGGSVRIAAFNGDTADEVSEVVIATVTVTGENPGTARLALDAASVGDESGTEQYRIVGATDAAVTVADDPIELSLRPRTTAVGVDGRTAVEIVAEGIDAGVGSYELSVNASNTTTAVLTGASTAIGGSGDTVLADDGSGVRLGAFNGDTNDTGPVTVGTVTVEGTAPGTVELRLHADSVSNETGIQYPAVATTGTALTVREAPDVTGDGNPATDPDGDGRYEDVNGDGDPTPGDATVLFRAAFNGTPAVMDNVALFDFSDDGEINPGDATVLFDEVF